MGKIQMLQESMNQRIDRMKQEASIVPLLVEPAVYDMRVNQCEYSKGKMRAAHRCPQVYHVLSFFGSTKFLIEPVKSSFPSQKTSLQLVHFKFDVRTSSAVDETASKPLFGTMMQHVRTDRMELGVQDWLAKLHFSYSCLVFLSTVFYSVLAILVNEQKTVNGLKGNNAAEAQTSRSNPDEPVI